MRAVADILALSLNSTLHRLLSCAGTKCVERGLLRFLYLQTTRSSTNFRYFLQVFPLHNRIFPWCYFTENLECCYKDFCHYFRKGTYKSTSFNKNPTKYTHYPIQYIVLLPTSFSSDGAKKCKAAYKIIVTMDSAAHVR